MTTTFETARIGDRVWSVEYGWGVIDSISQSVYPLRVRFIGYSNADMYIYFDLKGLRPNGGKNQTLFWDEVKIDAPKKPLPVLDIDTKVIVWNGNTPKTKRYFSHFNSLGEIVCFINGKTSWTTENVSEWPYWELGE